MKIFELLNPQAQQPLQQPDQTDQEQNPEDDEKGKFDGDKVDQNLQDLAQSGKDERAQPDLPQGAGSEPPELDDQNVKPIDDALVQQIKNEPYAQKWDLKGKGRIAPMKIAGMQLDKLSRMRNMIRFAMQNISVQDKLGTNQNKDMEWYSDLLKFVDTVMTFKKTNTKSQLAQINPTPAYQTQQ